jgi:hypothetical protein
MALGAGACTGTLGTSEGDERAPARRGSETPDPGTKPIHRLNTAEYNATVADVLGARLQPATASWRGGEVHGFDNMAPVLGVDAVQYERYFVAAEALVSELLENPAMRDKLIPCAAADDASCVRTTLDTAGLRIFRRPLADDERETYAKVYRAARALGDDHYASAGLMIRALLSSAEFLYRIEVDPDPTSSEKHPLNTYELASRLSYFLWSSAPDDKLLALAADESLADDAVLAETVVEMLADPKSERFVANFAGQWLGARRVVDHPTSPEVYPTWTPEIARAAANEIYSYFDEFLRSDRSWLEFLKADLNFVDPHLAGHYGIPAPASGAARIEHHSDERAGFFGLAGFLALTSMDRRTSPTLRGKWVLMNLMCTHPPDPPPGADIVEFEEEGENAVQNIREALELHRSEPACANCHALFDPFGLALEQFDGVGRFRTTYPDGSVIDPKADLHGVPFSGLEGAAEIVTSQPEFGPCVTEKMLMYALGRPLTPGDRAHVERLADEWLGGEDVPTLARAIQGVVLTEVFRYRRAADE